MDDSLDAGDLQDFVKSSGRSDIGDQFNPKMVGPNVPLSDAQLVRFFLVADSGDDVVSAEEQDFENVSCVALISAIVFHCLKKSPYSDWNNSQAMKPLPPVIETEVLATNFGILSVEVPGRAYL